jgi:Domain of unknown function (DUF6265)
MKIKEVIIFLFSISIFNYSQTDKFDWLLGEWKMGKANSYTIESWKQAGDNTIEGESFTFDSKNDSIIFSESLRILLMNGEYFYLAKVPQSKLPVAFKMSYYHDERIVFENSNHDFPQRIEYSKITDDSLRVTISLINKDKSQRTFHYRRR